MAPCSPTWDRRLPLRFMNLLIVDDDRAGADSLAELMARLVSGARVGRAYDGIEAVAMATEANERPDVIVTDIEMPHMTGVEVAHSQRGDAGPQTTVSKAEQSRKP